MKEQQRQSFCPWFTAHIRGCSGKRAASCCLSQTHSHRARGPLLTQFSALMTETFFSKGSNYIGSFLLLLSLLYYQLQDKEICNPTTARHSEIKTKDSVVLFIHFYMIFLKMWLFTKIFSMFRLFWVTSIQSKAFKMRNYSEIQMVIVKDANGASHVAASFLLSSFVVCCFWMNCSRWNGSRDA